MLYASRGWKLLWTGGGRATPQAKAVAGFVAAVGDRGLEPSDYDVEVITASVRGPLHVTEAARMGAHIATIPPKVFYQMLQHPLTTAGIATFTQDAEARKARAAGKTA